MLKRDQECFVFLLSKLLSSHMNATMTRGEAQSLIVFLFIVFGWVVFFWLHSLITRLDAVSTKSRSHSIVCTHQT